MAAEQRELKRFTMRGGQVPSLRVRELPEMEGKPLSVVREEAKKYGTPADIRDMAWVLRNQEREIAQRMQKENGVYFFFGDKTSNRDSAPHIHNEKKGLKTHEHGLFGWRKGDRVVYVDNVAR